MQVRAFVVVGRGVGYDEQRSVGSTPLDLLLGGATFGGAAPVISPRVRRSFDGFLAVLPPRPEIGRRAAAVGPVLAGTFVHPDRDYHPLLHLPSLGYWRLRPLMMVILLLLLLVLLLIGDGQQLRRLWVW